MVDFKDEVKCGMMRLTAKYPFALSIPLHRLHRRRARRWHRFHSGCGLSSKLLHARAWRSASYVSSRSRALTRSWYLTNTRFRTFITTCPLAATASCSVPLLISSKRQCRTDQRTTMSVAQRRKKYGDENEETVRIMYSDCLQNERLISAMSSSLQTRSCPSPWPARWRSTLQISFTPSRQQRFCRPEDII